MQKYFFTVLALFSLFLTGCDSKQTYLGYVEGQLTYVSAPVGGRLQTMAVVRGQTVKTGDKLFSLDPLPESTDVAGAQANVNQLSATLADKMKGSRPSEINAISQQLAAAQAQVDYSKKDLARKQELAKKGVIEKSQLDVAEQNEKVAEANVKQIQANLTTAKLPARSEQIQALQAQLSAAQETLHHEQWLLQQKTISAPTNAQVFDIYYQIGEQVAANQAVLSLLAPTDIKVVFFVDQEALAKIKSGQKITIKCDGCRSALPATIRFISPSAEFTPPIIYSRSARSKLVYEVEATFDPATAQKKQVSLHPGQPVDVIVKL